MGPFSFGLSSARGEYLKARHRIEPNMPVK